jgi:hypothetical protein
MYVYMDSNKLIGAFRGTGVRPNLYRPLVNNVYSTDNRIRNLYDFRTVVPTATLNYMYLTAGTPPWNYRRYLFSSTSASDGQQSIYWKDMRGSTLGNASRNMSITYNSLNNSFYQLQKMSFNQFASYLTLDTTKLLTGGIFNLNNGVDTEQNAYTSNTAIPFVNISNYSSTILSPYIQTSNSGIVLTNAFYNRNYFINASIYIDFLTVNTGATFTLYIYYGDNIVGQASLGCVAGEKNKILFANAVINSTVADVGKLINFKIKFTGTILTMDLFSMPCNVNFFCRTL